MESHWVVAGGFRIHTRTSAGAPLPRGNAGGKPALVLLHGAVISNRYFERIAPMLARWFDVYAPDLPGQGKSDKPPRALTVPESAQALVHWMEAAGIARASLAGHSLGCQAAAHVAATHAARVERLVLMGPTVAPSQRNAWSVIWRLGVDALLESKSLVLLEIVDLFRTGLRRAWQIMRAALADPIELVLPRVTQPTLVVRGSRDLLSPGDWTRQLATLLPNGAFVEVAGSAHAFHYSDAERTLAPVVAFLLGPGAAAEIAAPGEDRQAPGDATRGGLPVEADSASP
jgi:2-hydroxy-6-oxonona-2,4-dienedioate hydrolase